MTHDHTHCDSATCPDHHAEMRAQIEQGELEDNMDWGEAPEIEDAPPELYAVRSSLRLMLVNLLQVRGWPDHPAVEQWRRDIATYQQAAAQRFSLAMQERIDLTLLYGDANDLLEDGGYGRQNWPSDCPFVLEQLLRDERVALEGHLEAASVAVAG